MTGPPIIDQRYLPEPERSAASVMNHALDGLTRNVDSFYHAIQLFDHCIFVESRIEEGFKTAQNWDERKELFASRATVGSWRGMAGRDAAMTLYHFWHTMIGIGSSMHTVATVQERVDSDTIRKARQKFLAAFPDWNEVRNSVAHSGQTNSTPTKYEQSAARGGYAGKGFGVGEDVQRFTIANSWQGRTFTTTHEKRVVHFDLSIEAHAELSAIRDLVLSAFAGVNTHTQSPNAQ